MFSGWAAEDNQFRKLRNFFVKAKIYCVTDVLDSVEVWVTSEKLKLNES